MPASSAVVTRAAPLAAGEADRRLEAQQRVLAEKNNYIGKLEAELNEIRGECDHLKEKLIGYEMEQFARGPQ